MYFCGFDASWIDTPFWRTGFLITSPTDLDEVCRAGYETCWIDTDLGDDLPVPDDIAEAGDCPAVRADPIPSPLVDPWQEARRVYQETKALAKEMFAQVRLGKAVNLRVCQNVVEDLAAALTRDPDTLMSVLRLKQADEYVYAHSLSVCALMVALGRTIGLDQTGCREAGLAGYFHDVGKAFIPEEILNKPGQLTAAQYKLVQCHPLLGYRYLADNPRIPPAVAKACLHHHEKMDGSGYPFAKSGNEIDLYSRMAAICDVYDAVTSERPYKESWDPAAAISRMASWKGHFDPAFLSAFVKTIGIYPVGSVVKMRSGRYALVVRQNRENLLRPVVQILPIAEASNVGEPLRIDLADSHANDDIAEKIDEQWSSFKEVIRTMPMTT